MELERKIIGAAVHDRWAYEELDKYQIRKDLSDIGQIIWDVVDEFYHSDLKVQQTDNDLLKAAIERKAPKVAGQINQVLDSLEKTSSANMLREIREQKLWAVKQRLSQAFASDKEAAIEPLLEEYERLALGELENSSESDILIAPDLSAIMERRSAANRYKTLPESLNSVLEGGALAGHHIVVFAPTDMGKTLFTLNMVRGFINDGRKVLYVGNEDPVSDLIERFLICLTGRDKYTIRKHWKRAQVFAEKKGWDRLIWAELSPGTLGEIRALIEEHEPDVLVVDQIRNLDCGEKNYVRTLEVAAQGMRNFAKKYDLLSISVTQAGDSATGKAILNRGDIDNSNVGIPGTADLMLGIGATEDQELAGIRVLSFPKNKISGNKSPLQVTFNTKTMRVE